MSSNIIPTRLPDFLSKFEGHFLDTVLKKHLQGFGRYDYFFGGFPKSGSCTIYPSVKRKALQQKLVVFRLQLESRISEPSTISFQLSRVVIHGSLELAQRASQWTHPSWNSHHKELWLHLIHHKEILSCWIL